MENEIFEKDRQLQELMAKHAEVVFINYFNFLSLTLLYLKTDFFFNLKVQYHDFGSPQIKKNALKIKI